MHAASKAIVALSGGVDSAVAAQLLLERGYDVECLHMTNWDDDDGYCDAAADLQDARRICDRLGLQLHRVNFSREYRDSVFENFLTEIRAGRTPNPDILCNREIKFGVMRSYARRLGGQILATGHYARLDRIGTQPVLLKSRDPHKDQTYFLSSVASEQFSGVSFPLGELSKPEVRRIAERARLCVAAKRDSTGICFIGERPFAEFLDGFFESRPGPVVAEDGRVLGEHAGLHRYTLGQRKGIGLGGTGDGSEAPWYVAGKRMAMNELIVVQGRDHPALFSDWLETGPVHWIGPEPDEVAAGAPLGCQVRTRYRQADQTCVLRVASAGRVRVSFSEPQRAVTPGQFAVFYLGERCLGGARIERTARHADSLALAAEAC